MGDVLNLNKARKAAARQNDKVRAAENRVLHGRSKAEREFEAARAAKAHRDLDAHRIEKGDER
jgi:hypothetical protein